MQPLRLLETDRLPALERPRCLRSRFRPHDCRKCEAACPREAIAAEPGAVRIDAAACDGCMLCVPACPAEALRPAGRGFLSVVEDLAAVEQPVLGCWGREDTAAHARMECLGQLSGEQLLGLEMLVPGQVSLNASACPSCPRGECLPALEDRLNRVHSVAPGRSGRLRLVKDSEQLEPGPAVCDRRSLFRLFERRVSRGLASSIDTWLDREPSNRSKRPPERLMLLAAALKRLPPEERETAADTCFPRIQLNEACDHCCRCTAVCPTGALVRRRENGARHLEVIRTRCTACGVCEAFCPRDGIEVGGGLAVGGGGFDGGEDTDGRSIAGEVRAMGNAVEGGPVRRGRCVGDGRSRRPAGCSERRAAG